MRRTAVMSVLVFSFLAPPIRAATRAPAGLPHVVLQGDDGGISTGEAWDSAQLQGRTHLVLVLDPGKKKQAMPLIQRIDTLPYGPETLGITFVVNTSATAMPVFMIRMMLRQREKVNPRIQYVLDHNEILIQAWGLSDESVNVLLQDPSGAVVHRHAGEITEPYMDQLMATLDRAVAGAGRAGPHAEQE